jgi:hypothetical protein
MFDGGACNKYGRDKNVHKISVIKPEKIRDAPSKQYAWER